MKGRTMRGRENKEAGRNEKQQAMQSIGVTDHERGRRWSNVATSGGDVTSRVQVGISATLHVAFSD